MKLQAATMWTLAMAQEVKLQAAEPGLRFESATGRMQGDQVVNGRRVGISVTVTISDLTEWLGLPEPVKGD